LQKHIADSGQTPVKNLPKLLEQRDP